MNILYVCSDFGVPYFGAKGASVHVRAIVTSLADAGHTVTVVSPSIHARDQGSRPAFHEHCDGRIRLLEVRPDPRLIEFVQNLEQADPIRTTSSRLPREVRSMLYNQALPERVRMHLDPTKSDFVYERYSLWGGGGGRLARDWGVPHLLEVNAPLADEQERTRGLVAKDLARAQERCILNRAAAVLVVSRHLAEFAAANGVPAERIEVLPNGVDADRFAAGIPSRVDGSVRERIAGRFVIGFVGTLKPWHGVGTLVEAVRRIPQAVQPHLLLVGDGPERGKLEEQVRQLGLEAQTTFVGSVPHERMPDWIATFDVAVAPYPAGRDCYFSPLKLFEYWAAGKPVVAAGVGQIEELARAGAPAVLYQAGDAEALAHAMGGLAAEPERRLQLGRDSALWVRSHRTWAGNARRIVEIAEQQLRPGDQLAAISANSPRSRSAHGPSRSSSR